MTRRYGIVYQGSKNGIAEWVVSNLPPAKTFVDLFAGGCAVTHCALLSRKFERVIVNDITDVPKLFVDAVQGKYHNENRWISREDFFLLKDSDPYVRICWSFGGDGRTYLYHKEIEPLKRELHRIFYAGDPHKARLAWRAFVREWLKSSKKDMNGLIQLQSLERLQSLESLERLQSLESLERLQSLEVFQGDYRAVSIPDDATVYADPPYAGKAEYNDPFDHDAFYEWLRTVPFPVFVSEYTMPDDFVLIDHIRKSVHLSAVKNSEYANEGLFIHERFKDLIFKEKQQQLL